ncbi:unnamed protein product [Boreogadus saida]
MVQLVAPGLEVFLRLQRRLTLIKKHVAAVAALESEVGNPNAAVCGCMIEFRSAFVVLISREIVRQDVEVA